MEKTAKKFRILVADDDPDNRIIARDALELSGHQVIQATNGLEAVEMSLKEKPDLILLDLSMPKLNGWEAAKRIREAMGDKCVPIVAYTAHALQGAEFKAKAAGCDDYIAKPCPPRELVQRIEKWLE